MYISLQLCYRMHYRLTENSRFSNSSFELSGNTDSTTRIDSSDSLPIAYTSSQFQDESSTFGNSYSGMKEDRKRHQYGSVTSNDKGHQSTFYTDIDKGTLDRQQNFTKISNDQKKSISSKPSRGSRNQNDEILARLRARSELKEKELSIKGSSIDSYKKASPNRLHNTAHSLPTAKSKEYKIPVSSRSNGSVFRKVTEVDAKYDGITTKSDFRSATLGERRQLEVTGHDRSSKRSSKVKQSSLRNGDVSNYRHTATKTADLLRDAREPYGHDFHFNDAIDSSRLSSQRRISQDLPSSYKSRDRMSSDEFDGSSKHKITSRKIYSNRKRKG